MIDAITPNNSTTSRLAAYASSWEHISDELERLDLRIRLQLLRRQTRQPPNPLDQFRGLVLSEGEISGLLADEPDESADEIRANSSNSEYHTLISAYDKIEAEIESRLRASAEEGIYLSLPHLAQLFQLTTFERECLVICLAPELDRKYEKLYAYLQDDVTRKKPSVSLVMNLLVNTMEERLAARSVFDSHAPLVKFRLILIADNPAEGPTSLLSRFLRLDDRMVNFLLVNGHIDARLEQSARLVHPEANAACALFDEAEHGRIRSFIRSHFQNAKALDEKLVLYLHGPYGSGKRAFAESVSRDLGFNLILADAIKLLEGAVPFEETIWLLGREALLQPALLCFQNFDCLASDDLSSKSRQSALLEVVRTCCWLTFLSGGRSWHPLGPLKQSIFIDVPFVVPDDSARKHYWEISGERRQFSDDVELYALAGKFHFTPGQIEDALAAAQDLARVRSPDEVTITTADIDTACRAQSHHQLSALARKIKPHYTWSDIVLPSDTVAQLHDLCSRVAERQRVLGEWGFGRKLSLGTGTSALFVGPSGTGKTMAAEIIANQLDLDLFKIDLSGVVSKYIGETEKNLERIFTTAENANSILFFDEADALFGKRSEVRDSHDRYANIEVAYLLQRMEQYEGVAILATNLRQNIDEAFVRRLQFIIDFPFPDEFNRQRIWQGLYPAETPRAEEIDFAFLAKQFRIAGGSIKNITLGAAYLAASEDSQIEMKHLIKATQREFQKMGRGLTVGDLENYVPAN